MAKYIYYTIYLYLYIYWVLKSRRDRQTAYYTVIVVIWILVASDFIQPHISIEL